MGEVVAEEKPKKKRHFNLPILQRNTQYGAVDMVFLITVIVLLVIGIIMMFSASYTWAIEEGLEGSYYAVKQIQNAAIGIILMLILCMVDYHIFQKRLIAILAYGIPLILLILVFVPGIGYTEGGATRWIAIGSFNFQPSELMKLGIVIFLAYFIVWNEKNMKKFFKGMVPLFFFLLLSVVFLVIEPHLSATIIIAAMGVILMYIGGVNLKQFWITVVIVAALAIAFVVFYMMSSYNYIGVRLSSWLDPFSDIQDGAWQTCQSLIAIGSGGLFGLGLGESRQKYLYLPESKNDFVFAIVCEELGFVGAVMVILLFVLLVVRGLYIAAHAQDKFGSLIATGFTLHIGIQAFFNIAVVSNLVPNTGISLPFFSYGGTALILQLVEMGIVLNISRSRKRVTKEVTPPVPTVEEVEQDFLQEGEIL